MLPGINEINGLEEGELVSATHCILIVYNNYFKINPLISKINLSSIDFSILMLRYYYILYALCAFLYHDISKGLKLSTRYITCAMKKKYYI